MTQIRVLVKELVVEMWELTRNFQELPEASSRGKLGPPLGLK